MVWRWLWVLTAAMTLAGCSDPSAAPDSTTSPPEAAATSAPTLVEESATPTVPPVPTEPAAPTVPPTPTEPPVDDPAEAEAVESAPAQPGSVAPLEASDREPSSNVVSDPATAWISRRFMTDSAIEVVWSAIDGAVEYQVHRLPRSGDDEPEAAEMDSENVIHSDVDRGVFLDDGVSAGSSYWHGVRGFDETGTVVAVGWHRTVALTDEQPPEPVRLSVEQENGAVLLTWSAPAENYQLHSYRVLRAVDGGEPESLATTWNLDQTSFLDAEPPETVVTYSVVAFDFHWNRSEPATVTVDRSS